MSAATGTTWLVGDVGATNARFGLVSPDGAVLHSSNFACADFAETGLAIEAYLALRGNLPMPRQGALAIETRVGESICQALDHAATRAAVTAERAVLRSLGGGCLTPIGAHARVEQNKLLIMAIVISTDGAQSVRDTAEGPADEAERIGRELGERLLQQGAAQILSRSLQHGDRQP